MKFTNKLTTSMMATVALVGVALTGCQDETSVFEVNAPSWIDAAIDSIAEAKANASATTLYGMMEDVYTIGETDYSSGWWTSFSKYYQIPKDTTWNAVFNLNINSDATAYYQNFALVLTNDYGRDETGYTEYGAFRFDYVADTVTYNSLWGTYLYFKYADSETPSDPDNYSTVLSNMAGKVTLSVTRAENSFSINITNGTVNKTYSYPYSLKMAGVEEDIIRAFLVPEGSYINFLQTNIEPIGGCTSALDKEPVSIELDNLPETVFMGGEDATIYDLLAGVTATVTFEEDVTKTVDVTDLTLTAIPDITTSGTKTLIVAYSYTYKGETTATPVMTMGTFQLMDAVKSLAVETTIKGLYYFSSEITNGLERLVNPEFFTVTATLEDGSTKVMDSSNFTFSTISSLSESVDSVSITVTFAETISTSIALPVILLTESDVVTYQTTVQTLGDGETNTWWVEFSDDMKIDAYTTSKASFTQAIVGSSNWNTFCAILRQADATEYCVVRSDNYGWGNGYSSVTLNCSYDWDTYLTDYNGATVDVYTTNVGSGYSDMLILVTTTGGTSYYQYYVNIETTTIDDVYLAFTSELGQLVFDESNVAK